MRRAFLAVVGAVGFLQTVGQVRAQDATWTGATSGDWQTDSNWNASVQPTGTAAFGSSSQTTITFSNNDVFHPVSVGTIQLDVGSPTYTFKPSYFSFTGAGIVNNSSNAPTLAPFSALSFLNGSTAANANIVTTASAGTFNYVEFRNTSTADHANISQSGATYFYDTSTAGNATINTTVLFAGNGGVTSFLNGSSAGSATLHNDGGARTLFVDTSTAASATISNIGVSSSPSNSATTTSFSNNSTAGNATIDNTNGGRTEFHDASTAGTARITNAGKDPTTGLYAALTFQNGSSAANATIVNNAFGITGFSDSSTAANAAITNNNGGVTSFLTTSTAGNATIINNSGGQTVFAENSTAGNARLIANAGGVVSFVGTGPSGNNQVSAGSIEGAGLFSLGSNNLTVGGNNLSTEVSGTIQGAGSLTKIGTGTLILSGTSNSYLGSTVVNAGVLKGGANNAFSAASATSVTGGATLDLGGFAQTINSVNVSNGTVANGALAGAVTLASGTLNNISGTAAVTASTINVFFGTNTYTGTTTIVSGLLGAGQINTFSPNSAHVLGAAATLSLNDQNQAIGSLAGSGDVDLGTAVLTIGGNNQSTVYSGLIHGIGSLVKIGTGTLTLTNSGNNYVTGTVISGGTVAADASSALGGAGGAVTFTGTAGRLLLNNAELANTILLNAGVTATIDAGASATLSGGILLGAQTKLYLNPNNGGLNNLLFLANSGASVDPASNVIIQGGVATSTAGGAALLSQIVQIDPAGRLELNTQNVSISALFGSGRITSSNGARVLSLDGGLYGGQIQETGGQLALTKFGNSVLELDGTNTYTGPTTVNGGILYIKGSIASSATTVNDGGMLVGTGELGATQINAGGKLVPGLLTGDSMTLASLAMQSGAVYYIQLNPTTASFASVAGTATLGGATVNAAFDSGAYVAKKYTILTAGSVSGTFAPTVVNTSLPSGFHTSLSYDATHVYLDLALNFVPPPGHGLSGNQQNVGNAIINFFNSNGSIPIVFGGLTPNGLSQLTGEGATAPQQTTFQAMTQFMGVMTDPFMAGRGDTAGPGGNPTAYAEEWRAYAQKRTPNDALAAIYNKAPPLAPSFEQRWSVWAAAFGGSQQTDGNAALGSNNATSSIYGTAVGADYRLSSTTIAGFALAGGGTNFTVANNLGGGRSDLFQAGAFIRHNIGPAYLSGALAYGWQDITTDRTVTAAGIDRLKAQFNANAWSGRVEGGYRFVAYGFGFTPYAAGQFTTFDLPGYAEQAIVGSNNFALAYNARSVTDTRSELGLRSDRFFAMMDGILTLRGRAAWAHDFNPDRSIAATFQTLPGASFVVNGAAMSSDSALVTGSAEMKWLNGWSAAATFEGEFSSVTRSYAGKSVVRYAW